LAALTILPAIPAAALIARDSHPTAAWIVLTILTAMALSGVAQMLPFTRLWPKEVGDITPDQGGASLTILVANICYESEQYEAVSAAIQQTNPDLLLLIEPDQTWREALADLASDFPHRIEDVAGEGLGLALWSKLELHDTKIEHVVSKRRPSMFANIALADGRSIRFVGLHPTPPGLKDST